MRLSLLCLSLAIACSADPDRDGLPNSEERELGTGIGIADSDNDGLKDGEEVYETNTDPLAPDSDLDGALDGEEVEAASDPNDPLSYPDGIWPDGSARIPDDAPRSWDTGGHAPDFRGTDQDGATLRLDALYGHVVVIQLVAGEFCGACVTQADAARELQAERASEGFYVVHILVDDDSRDGEVDGAFAATWADRHTLDFPVLVSPEGASSLFNAGLYKGDIPLTVLLDRGHRVQGHWQSSDGLSEAAAMLPGLLGQDVP